MSEYKYVVGVDVGGTSIKFGLFDLVGNLLEKWNIPTNTKNNSESLLRDISNSVISKLETLDIPETLIKGLGIAVPGPVNSQGTILACVNLGWRNKNICEELKQLCNIEISVANDANIAALGELWQGGGKGYENIVFITLGTGVGGGIIMNGEIIHGKHGIGGEIGHFCVDTTPDAKVCNCGNCGCLEQYSSATAILRNARKYMSVDTDDLTAKDVFRLAMDGDKNAEKAVDIAADKLGYTISNISVIIDTEVFLLGGGVSNAGDYFIDKIRTAYDKYNPFCKSKDIVIATSVLGNDAGIYGAAKLALNKKDTVTL